MNILVTGVGGDIGQGVLKCLRESGDFKLIGCDIDPYSAGRTLVDVFEQAPKTDDVEAYLKFIREIRNKQDIKYIYPITESEISLFNQHREIDNVLINSRYVVDTFFDKYKTVGFLKDYGINYPETYLIEEFTNQINYPVIIKNRRSWGSKGITVVKDSEAMDFYKEQVNNAIVQEYLGTEDNEYTVGVFSDGINIHSICFHRYLGYGGLTKFAEIYRSDEISRIVERIARCCGLSGVLNVQFRKTDKGFIPFEVNARLSGTVYFRHVFGFQDVKWWLDMKEGKPISYTPKYKKGIGVRMVSEVFYDKETI